MDMDERLAIARLKQGDIGGLEILVKLHSVQAVRTSYLITGDQAAAEDIVQEAFIRAYKRINQFDDTRPFAPWFLRSVVNDSVKVLTKDKTTISLEAETVEAGDSLAEMLPTEIDELDQFETQEAIREALDKLTPSQRAAVILRYYLDFTELEAAEMLDCPPNTLKWWMSQARLHLKALLQAFRPAHDTANSTTYRRQYRNKIEKEIKP